MTERSITTRWLDKPVRGPGGHWHQYIAVFSNDEEKEGRLKGYGSTALEAITTLKRLAVNQEKQQ